MLKRNAKIIIISVLVLGCLTIGFFAGRLSPNNAYQRGLEAGMTAGVQKGTSETEQKYEAKIAEIYPSIAEPEVIRSVAGLIKEVLLEENAIVVEELVYGANPFVESSVRNRKVRVSENTEIVEKVQMTPGEFAAEKARLGGVDPYPFKEVPVGFDIFQTGGEVLVETDSNIKGMSEFEAAKIVVY